MPSILVVDDDEGRRESLSATLTLSGFEARAVGSAEAVEVARRGRFALALVDLMLHGTNGFELSRSLLAEAHVRVVLTSDYHFSEPQLSRIDCGAVGFVPRPCAFDELTSFLRAKIPHPALSSASQTQ